MKAVLAKRGWHYTRKCPKSACSSFVCADRVAALKRETLLFRWMTEQLGPRRDMARLIDWQLEAPPFFLESEYTPGGSLSQWAEKLGGLLNIPLSTRLNIVAQTATALHAAHSVGVLHVDVKPSNILITNDQDGHPCAVLADFGVGRVIQKEMLREAGYTTTAAMQTHDTRNAYSPLYVAPEIRIGKQPEIQSDIYSLGIVLYQMIVGNFAAAPAEGFRDEIDDELLREDIARCIHLRPERRFGTALELAASLRDLEKRRAEREAELLRQRRREARRRRERLALKKARDDLAHADYIHRINLAQRDWDAGNLVRAWGLLTGCNEKDRHWEWYYLNRVANPERCCA